MKNYRVSEIEHSYGSNIHILNDPTLTSLLARLCSPETIQPEINSLVEVIYRSLVQVSINAELPRLTTQLPTRMTALHPAAKLEAEVLDRSKRAVTVNLARAGTFPSHVCYDLLNRLLDPQLVRQDHVLASRLVDGSHKVTGTALAGAKIGGDVEGAVVFIPDPMGATGNTLVSILEHYKRDVGGTAAKYIALHLIVSPEYLKKITTNHPDVVVYAVRVDRGLSSPKVLASTPGQFWSEERGLDERHYIVPGGGGFGEIMNNSFV